MGESSGAAPSPTTAREPDGAGSKVTVTADINPRTFWRKRLLVKIRRVGLRKEMQESLEALAAFVAS